MLSEVAVKKFVPLLLIAAYEICNWFPSSTTDIIRILNFNNLVSMNMYNPFEF